MKNLFPRPPRGLPYYIYAPSYTIISSGIRTLHLLCHALNEVGEIAYLSPILLNLGEGWASNPTLNTPATFTYPDFQNYYGNNFIAVYPDIVQGNPLNAKYVVRYLLAPAGMYGGDATFPPTDNIWGALPSLAKKVLRLPVSNPDIFYIPPPYSVRQGSCFYAHKYDKLHGNTLCDTTRNSVRLEGSLEQIADILRNSERCYLYELSSIITEAALCGCPVTLIRTPYFNTIDSSCMMGNVCWDNGETVKKCEYYLPEYDAILDNFWNQLEVFIEDTQRIK